MLNNTHDNADFDSPLLNIYIEHKISMIRVRRLACSQDASSVFVNATITVNFDE